MALIAHLARTGGLDADDIDDIATELDEKGEGEAAHLCRVAYLEAFAPKASEWNAQKARARMRLVSSDGGNEGA